MKESGIYFHEITGLSGALLILVLDICKPL